MTAWQLRLAAAAQRSLAALPPKVAAAVVEFMLGPLPAEPCRAGRPLSRELTGYYSARRGAYRVVYRLDKDAAAVDVVRLEHRSRAYRRL